MKERYLAEEGVDQEKKVQGDVATQFTIDDILNISTELE